MKKNFLFIGLAWMMSSISYAVVPQQVTWDAINYIPFYFNTGKAVNGNMIWGDYNNDGHLDVFLIVGQGSNTDDSETGQVFLWKNNGDGTFSHVHTSFIPLTQPAAEFIDYNNDGNLDLIVMGNIFSPGDKKRVVMVYKNSGPPCYDFIEDKERSAEFIAASPNENSVQGRHIQAVDFDHDGWTDLIITGWRQTRIVGEANDRLTRIFKNVGGKFELQTGNVTAGGHLNSGIRNFYELSRGSVHVGDINRDGYADIVVTGRRSIPTAGDWAHLYINNGNGTFRQLSEKGFNSTVQRGVDGETIFADVNGDGYDDIVEVLDFGGQQQANIYINNKDETFTKYDKSITGLIGANAQISITAGDVNNDGLLDLYITGNSDLSAGGSGRIFYNNGDGKSFTVAMMPEVARAREGRVCLVDIDRDGNLDYSCSGYDGGGLTVGRKKGLGFNKLIDAEGNPIQANTPPMAPNNVRYSYDGEKYVLTWDKASDKETPQEALRYNVFAKEKLSGMVYVYAPVHIATGKLKIGGSIVPLITPNSFEWFLPEGDYEFGVQTIDQADVASLFTPAYGVGIDLVRKNTVRVFTDNNKNIVIENIMPTAVPYTVLNVSGQIVTKGVCPAGTQQTVPGLAQGVYIVKTEGNFVKVPVF